MLNMFQNRLIDVEKFNQKYLTYFSHGRLSDPDKRNREACFAFLLCLGINDYSISVHTSIYQRKHYKIKYPAIDIQNMIKHWKI